MTMNHPNIWVDGAKHRIMKASVCSSFEQSHMQHMMCICE